MQNRADRIFLFASILYNNLIALVMQSNTLIDPEYKVADTLKTFDYSRNNPFNY